MHPEIISIGSFMVPTYGLLVALGFLAGIWIAARLASRSGLDSEKVTNLGVYCALAGLAGAKLLMVILDLGYYLENPGGSRNIPFDNGADLAVEINRLRPCRQFLSC